MKLYFDENIAVRLYEATSDMDAGDYAENKENEIELLNNAISKLYSYSCYDDDFFALYSALYTVYGD